VTIVSHILATTLGVKLFHLEGRSVVLAYLFGVAVDIDHLIKLPYYLRAVGWKDKRGYYWRSSLQEPVALLWIIPLCIFLGTVVPAAFFMVHLAMDYAVRYEKMPWYPYSAMVSRGWLTRVPDTVKEGILFAILLCSNAYLVWTRR
jgi:hypothetical protein